MGKSQSRSDLQPSASGICFHKENTEPVPNNIPLTKTFTTNEDSIVVSLLDATLKDTPKFIPNLTIGRVLKVYDGDTITVASRSDNGGKIWKWSVRLRGIDSAEIRGSDEQEKKIAKIAKTILKNRLMPNDIGQIVELKNIAYDKYGRILCNVYHLDSEAIAANAGYISLSKWMIDQGLAVKYDGGTKQKVNWTELHNQKQHNNQDMYGYYVDPSNIQ